MIEEHLDPTTEAHAHITNLLRTVVTAAAGVAERRARQREEQQRDAQRRSDEHRRALNERLAAERHTAQLVYRRAHQDSWWDKARPDDIAAAVEAAGTWAAADPRAGDALDHITERLHDRYGIDLADLYRTAQDPAVVAGTVRDRLAHLEQTQAETAPTSPWNARTAVLEAAGPGARRRDPRRRRLAPPPTAARDDARRQRRRPRAAPTGRHRAGTRLRQRQGTRRRLATQDPGHGWTHRRHPGGRRCSARARRTSPREPVEVVRVHAVRSTLRRQPAPYRQPTRHWARGCRRPVSGSALRHPLS